MTFPRSETFRSIDQILAADVLPALYRSQKLPLRISCLGVASYDASDAPNSFDRVIPLGECPSPEEAIQAAAVRLSRVDICTGPDNFPCFQPRIMLIQDRDQRRHYPLATASRLRCRGMQDRNRGQPPARYGVSDIRSRRGETAASPRRCTGSPVGRSLLARDLGRSTPPATGRLSFTHSIPFGSAIRRAMSCPETVMADYYTHFSCLLDVGTPENAARALNLYNALADENAAEDQPSDGFLLSIQPEHGGTQLWMRDDVTGDPEHVIQFVKRCAAEFSLSGSWGFQYANSCSKPRIDGFGGGAHVLDLVTGETVVWIYTDGWLSSVLEGRDSYA